MSKLLNVRHKTTFQL